MYSLKMLTLKFLFLVMTELNLVGVNTLWGWGNMSINRWNKKKKLHGHCRGESGRHSVIRGVLWLVGNFIRWISFLQFLTLHEIQPCARETPATENIWINPRREMLEKGFLNSASKISDRSLNHVSQLFKNEKLRTCHPQNKICASNNLLSS